MRITFVSFCTPAFADPMLRVLSSARAHGATQALGRTREELERTAIYKANRVIFDAPRGAGYWAWKPYFILETLKSVPEGEVVIYSDAGRAEAPLLVDRPLGGLVQWVLDQRGGILPGVYIPQWGPSRRWTKGECFQAMGCDTAPIRDHPQIQATFSVWQRNDRAMAFVAEWLAWCTRPEAICDERQDGDIPNAPDFIDHRHDQSVLTNLALLNSLRCFGDPLEVAVGGNTPNPADKRLGHLIDRIEGRTWAARARIAHESQRLANLSPNYGPTAPLRLAKRYAASWFDAIAHYPRPLKGGPARMSSTALQVPVR